MFTSKNLVYSIDKVPSFWVFNNYLHLDENLNGQDIKIKSLWNTADSIPSMCIYVDRKRREYYFKDFSSGKYGNKINLIQELFSLQYSDAVNKLIEDYNEYISKGGNTSPKTNVKANAKWVVDYIHTREWNRQDANYWLQYNIGTTILESFNVKPIEYYNMVKDESGTISQLVINGQGIYGYYTDDKAYKIYQPHKQKHKFHKISNYTQGLDQLKYENKLLVICSSLKDAMCLSSMNFKLEVIAPDSENTLIKPYIIDNLKNKYQYIICIFDNDKAGIKAIAKYEKNYNIKGLALQMSKDISDSVKDYGIYEVKKNISAAIKSCLNI